LNGRDGRPVPGRLDILELIRAEVIQRLRDYGLPSAKLYPGLIFLILPRLCKPDNLWWNSGAPSREKQPWTGWQTRLNPEIPRLRARGAMSLSYFS